MSEETPRKLVVDCLTGEQKYVDLSAEEVAERQALALESQAAEEERLAEESRVSALKDSARSKLVAGQPLTEEEAATLVI